MLIQEGPKGAIAKAWPDKEKIKRILGDEVALNLNPSTHLSNNNAAFYSQRFKEETHKKVVAAIENAASPNELIETITKEISI